MGSVTAPSIPTFDLSADPRTLERGTAEWNLMARKICSAFETTGAILVKHDSVTAKDREEQLAAMRSLFDLPVETKRRNTAKESLTTYPGANSVVPLYQSQGVMNAVDFDKAMAFTRLMWPEGNDKFCETINSMSKKMVGILETIFDMVVDGYGVGKDDAHIGRTDALSHMIKYTAPEKEEPALGLSPHVDINYLTILGQNEVEGLSIKRKEGDDWIPVDPGTDHFVIFAGSSLQAWSNGKVHPPFHRVVFRGLKDRLTWTVFLMPKPDQTVEPAPEFLDEERPPRYRPFAYGEFHQHCVATLYAAGEHVLQEYAGI